MKRLVLIDGINFFYKGCWSGGVNLSVRGENVTYIYAFVRNLITLIRRFEEQNVETTFIVCWDRGYSERIRISSEARDKGIIPMIYKQERRDAKKLEDEETKELNEEFKRQMIKSEELLGYTKIRQIYVQGEEADDLIGSFVFSQKNNFDDFVLVTSDRDYYQLLYPKVRIFNSGKGEFKDISFLKSEYNLDNPEQWVDVGALAGESGKGSDTIFGVPGIGYLTAAKLIAQYQTLDNLLSIAKKELSKELGDFNGDAMELYKSVKDKKYKLKHHVKEMYILAFENVVEIAKKLKKMRTWLDIKIPETNPSFEKLDNEFHRMSFQMGTNDLDILTIGK